MKYISSHDILIINALIIEQTGGADGGRDTHLLASAAERPRATYAKKELYRGIFEKAAVYLESLTSHHVFIDGNKRTSLAVTARFLFLNKYELTATNKEVEEYTVDVATGEHEIKEIAIWLKKHSKKKK